MRASGPASDALWARAFTVAFVSSGRTYESARDAAIFSVCGALSFTSDWR
ncbi:hypothetical protein COEX109129_40025 [Corallococcus exiguus]